MKRNKIFMTTLIVAILALMTLIFGLLAVPAPNPQRIQRGQNFQTLADAKNTIEKNEKSFLEMRPENEKKFFLQPMNKITETGIVYIPGFSATRRELSPVVENLAQQLNANLFMSRLTGHGQSAEEFAFIHAEDFISDGFEAVSVSRVLAKKKIWIATSTGALVALWMAQHYPSEISALILVSPAFDLHSPQSRLLAGYFGPLVRKFLVGPYREWKPLNSEQEKYWHIRYRSESLTALTRLIAWTKNINKKEIKIPTLILYTPQDQIVSLKAIHEVFEQLGSSEKKLIRVDAEDHVLTGDIASPKTTALVTQEMLNWLNSLK